MTTASPAIMRRTPVTTGQRRPAATFTLMRMGEMRRRAPLPWAVPLVVFVVCVVLAQVSLWRAPGLSIIDGVRHARFTTTAFELALAGMMIPVALANYRWPRATLLNLAALLCPLWYETAIALAKYYDAVLDGTAQLAWSAAVSAVAIFLGLAGWVGGRMRQGSAVAPPPGFGVTDQPTW
jgi:hypothetical protein